MADLALPPAYELVVDVQRVRTELARMNDVGRVQEFIAQAAAVEEYLRQRGDGRALAAAGEAVLLGRTRLGELLAVTVQHGGDRRQGYTVLPCQPAPPKLADLGLSKTESHRLQQLASVPAPVREAYFAEARAAEVRPSQSHLLKLAKQHARTELAAELNARPLPAPDGRYHVLVVDPPWRYDARADDVTHRGRNPYPDLTVEQICALPVGERAEADCVLWLWCTNAFLRDAFACLDAWGFQYRNCLTWAKDRMGVGDWLRGQTEHCLLATRGRPAVNFRSTPTLLLAPLRAHSQKPDEFFTLVERTCPGVRLEFFSRTNRPGWASWGAETGALK